MINLKLRTQSFTSFCTQLKKKKKKGKQLEISNIAHTVNKENVKFRRLFLTNV